MFIFIAWSVLGGGVDLSCFEVTLTTKNYASEISWSIGLCSSNSAYGNNQEYTQQCCLALGSHSLKCKDSYGDGWHGGYIVVDGIKQCENFSSGSVQTIEIIRQGRLKLHLASIYMIFQYTYWFTMLMVYSYLYWLTA